MNEAYYEEMVPFNYFLVVSGSNSDDCKQKLEVALSKTGFYTEIHAVGERELLPIGFGNEGHEQLVLTGDVAKVEGQKSAIRNEIIQQTMDLKGTILQFKDILSDALKGTLTSLNNLAYKFITKQRLKKKLESQLIPALLQQGECICLTLDVERSEAAIADPSQITIKKNKSDPGAFLDSITFALVDKYDAQSVHDGFPRGTFGASILQGLARENITGFFHDNINDKLCSISREKIKQYEDVDAKDWQNWLQEGLMKILIEEFTKGLGASADLNEVNVDVEPMDEPKRSYIDKREAVEANAPKFYETFSEDTANVLLAAHINEYVSNAFKKENQ
ncbi:18185_t:CDS:10 [Funneliformis geosporum]|nr:18185_t:CDS:10 [Funneliformis geosporum]